MLSYLASRSHMGGQVDLIGAVSALNTSHSTPMIFKELFDDLIIVRVILVVLKDS